MVNEAIRLAAGNVSDLAEEAGISVDALYSWGAGRRNPTRENLEKLAAVLERRGGELAKVAAKLRASAGG